MKLRIHRNSLRLRLSRSHVERFRKTGICTDAIGFGSASQLTYTLETSSSWREMEARYNQDCIRILLPLEMAEKWAGSDQVSLSLERDANSGPSLLVEKDFQCLHSDERDLSKDADSFPSPSADDQGK